MTSTKGPAPSDPRRRRFLKYPLGFGGANVLVTTTEEDHLRDLILQLLFTTPGERVNLPEFGAGVHTLVFEPSGAVAVTAQFLISSAVQRWLGDRLDVVSVDVQSDPGSEETVTLTIAYVTKSSQTPQSLVVQL